MRLQQRESDAWSKIRPTQRLLRSRVNRIVIFRSRGESDGLALIHRRATRYVHTRKTRINLNFKHRPRETGRADGTERERERTSRHSGAKSRYSPTRFSRANITIVPDWESLVIPRQDTTSRFNAQDNGNIAHVRNERGSDVLHLPRMIKVRNKARKLQIDDNNGRVMVTT